MNNRVLLALLPALLLVACGGTDNDEPTGQSAVAVCNGSYQCTYDADSIQVELQRDSQGTCHAGQLEVQADGTIESDGTTMRLNGTTARFTICADGETDTSRCIQCVDPDAPATPSSSTSHEGKCTGSPTSCSYGYAGRCSSIQGCSFNLHSHYDGSSEFVCEGYADSCDEMTSESECKQQGCTWK